MTASYCHHHLKLFIYLHTPSTSSAWKHRTSRLELSVAFHHGNKQMLHISHLILALKVSWWIDHHQHTTVVFKHKEVSTLTMNTETKDSIIFITASQRANVSQRVTTVSPLGFLLVWYNICTQAAYRRVMLGLQFQRNRVLTGWG